MLSRPDVALSDEQPHANVHAIVLNVSEGRAGSTDCTFLTVEDMQDLSTATSVAAMVTIM